MATGHASAAVCGISTYSPSCSSCIDDDDERQCAASLDVAAGNSNRLKQVLQRHQRVFTDVLPVKTAEQIAQAKQFSIVLIGDAVRPVKQRERRVSPAEIAAAPSGCRKR